MTRLEKLKRLPHIISGIVILLHGVERMDAGHHTYPFFLAAGVVFMAIAIFHHRIAVRLPRIDILFYAIEGALDFTIAWEYFEAGKALLPYAYIAAGIFQTGATVYFALKKPAHH